MPKRVVQLRGSVCRRGFSLIELVVVIGVVMILIGLAIPSLGGARARAQLTRAMMTARQAAILVQQYTRTSRDVYPITGAGALSSQYDWPDALIAAGLAGSYREIDQDLAREPDARMSAVGGVNWYLSMALCYDPNLMTPGNVVKFPGNPPVVTDADFPFYAVRTDQVVYPSDKGMLGPAWVMWGPQIGPWCCIPNPQPAPVAFCDTHAESLRYDECVKDGILRDESGIGSPVYSTWYGYKGRDRVN